MGEGLTNGSLQTRVRFVPAIYHTTKCHAPASIHQSRSSLTEAAQLSTYERAASLVGGGSGFSVVRPWIHLGFDFGYRTTANLMPTAMDPILTVSNDKYVKNIQTRLDFNDRHCES